MKSPWILPFMLFRRAVRPCRFYFWFLRFFSPFSGGLSDELSEKSENNTKPPNQRFWFPLIGSPRREGWACLGSSARPRRHARGQAASYQTAPPPRKIRLISWGSMSLVSDIKLIRTDSTLDLSQKAEKGISFTLTPGGLYTLRMVLLRQPIWD